MSKIHSFLTGVFALLIAVLASCTDDLNDGPYAGNVPARAAKNVDNPAGLIQQADGTWKTANCRVPIVGPGRIVNDINPATVNVVGVGNGVLSKIIDTDIDNGTAIPAVVKANVENPLVSVKDLYHIYAAGQKVGFIYRDAEGAGAKLLTLDLLKSTTLTTYLRGKKQELIRASDEKGVLKLDLLTLNTGELYDRVIAMDATKPFDEVRMGFSGVSAEAAAKVSILVKYAFVGENPEIRATSEPAFQSYWTGGSPGINTSSRITFTDISKDNAAKIVDADLTNYGDINSGVLGLIAASNRATVNFKRNIPAGTEIGYNYSAGEALNLSLFGKQFPRLTTYNSSNSQVEELKTGGSLLKVGLLNNAKNAYISMVTTKDCSQLRIVRPTKGILLPGLLDLSAIHVYYAYVREPVKTDPVNYFTFGNDITFNYAYRLPKAEVGNVEYYVLSYPYGTNPTVEDGKLVGMTKDGAYRVQAFYTAPDGRQVSHVATIYHKSNAAQEGCNRFITAKTHGAYATEALNSPKGICLLCLFNGTNNLNNVVDANDDNYAKANQLLSVLGSTPVAAFQLVKPVVPSGKIRTGFLVQANSRLLDLKTLSHFKIRLYNKGALVSGDTSDDKSSVKLGLLGFDKGKLRLSVETNRQFDRIELWRTGVADLLTSMRIYNIFYEPVSCDASSDGGACMEMFTNLKDNLQVDYDGTKIDVGLLSVGTSITNLEYMLDGNAETGAAFGSVLSASKTTIALKFNRQKGNQAFGIILSGPKNLADVELAKIGVLKVFNDDKQVASTTDADVLGVSLLSEGGRIYIEVTPKEDFNRIEFTTAGLDLLKNTKITGVYLRPDSDGDGIPDCADTDKDGDKLGIDGDYFHICYGMPLIIPLKQSVKTTDVSLYCYDEDKNENLRCKGKIADAQLIVPAKALPVGRYKLYVYSADGEYLLAYDINATVHPQTATWKVNPVSTSWNEWANWKEGSPWKCTNVILPANAAYYPELTGAVGNYCKNLHFESGAELVGTQYLTMEGKAFVDKVVQGGRYYLFSAPLQEMYTGDMFILPGMTWGKDKYFTPLSADNYAEKRNSPIVFQHFWNGTAMEKHEDGTDEDVSTAKWSADFNAVNTRYAVGQGFLLRAGKAKERSSYVFRFPKTHATYRFYRSDGTPTGKTEKLNRNAANIGKLAMARPGTVTLKNKHKGNVFLMGNPFMTHINVAKLMAANKDVIKEIRVCRTGFYDPMNDIESQTLSSKTNSWLTVAPMEAFFIVATNEGTSLNIKLTGDMLMQKRKLAKRKRR